MLFDGQELRAVLNKTENEIELRNEHGRCHRMISRDEALAFDLDLFIGVGNRRRIRFLRLRSRTYSLNAGSRNTLRLKDSRGLNIAHPLIRQHRRPEGIE
jgi:hypothetical protein